VRLTHFLDKGTSLDPDAPCLTMAGNTRTCADVQRLSWKIARALSRSGIRPGEKVAVLSANDPIAFCCIFGIARAGAVWCPVNPRQAIAKAQPAPAQLTRAQPGAGSFQAEPRLGQIRRARRGHCGCRPHVVVSKDSFQPRTGKERSCLSRF
jgi:acyl-CoA synthetase (AMP-forming)/AMP-acid ligase II